MSKFNVETQYQSYLKKVNLKESDMGPTQRREMRRTFFGAWGQCLVMLTQDTAELDDDQAIEAIDDQIDQVNNFWKAEVEADSATKN